MSKASNDKFTRDLQAIIKAAQGKAELAVKKIALETAKSLIQKSPVDEGRFVANWNLSINGIDPSTDTKHDEDNPDRNRQIAIDRTSKPISQYRLGDRIYITNNLEYAQLLEYGYSKKAPQGMVRITLAELEQYAAKVAADVRKGKG